ncbi:membrane-associated transporter protein-like [Branchiostoma lanceolatum]|uniref:membrane-associated transporter protein-like n=1 Tax=Branchiostoma lanceolatum TaxID=7740 RepID=UPI0034529CEC
MLVYREGPTHERAKSVEKLQGTSVLENEDLDWATMTAVLSRQSTDSVQLIAEGGREVFGGRNDTWPRRDGKVGSADGARPRTAEDVVGVPGDVRPRNSGDGPGGEGASWPTDDGEVLGSGHGPWPTRTTCELLLNSSIMLGREFCYAVEAALVTPILLTIGLPKDLYSVVWIISPVLGFVLQPVLGSYSDRCRSWLGRRRPFILGFSVSILLGFLLFLFGDAIMDATMPHDNTTWTIVITMAGIVLFDFSADFIETPIRAYLLDTCGPRDRENGLKMQGLFAGIGGFLGYSFSGIDWEDTFLGRTLGSEYHVIFVFAATSFVITALMNLSSIPEDSFRKHPTTAEAARQVGDKSGTRAASRPKRGGVVTLILGYESNGEVVMEPRYVSRYGATHDVRSPPNHVMTSRTTHDVRTGTDGGITFAILDPVSHVVRAPLPFRQHDRTYPVLNTLPTRNAPYDTPVENASYDQEQSLLETSSSMGSSETLLDVDETFEDISAEEARGSTTELPGKLTMATLVRNVVRMPGELVRLCVAHLLGWMAFLCIVLFYTDFMGRAVYHGNPHADRGSRAYRRYEEGVEMGSWGLAINALSCALYSIALRHLTQVLSLRTIYLMGYLIFSVGVGIMAILPGRVPSHHATLPLCAVLGIMYATLCTVPYTLVSQYAQDRQNADGDVDRTRGIGIDVAMVTSMIQLAQIVVGALLGVVVSALGNVVAVPVCASALGCLGCIVVAMFVKYDT